MKTRIGTVTKTYPSSGKVQVMFEDEKCASLPLSMLTMNQEYSMPSVGDRVVTLHMENGSSKGFVLGTYYGGGMQPKANSGYRKEFGSGAYATCRNSAYRLTAGSIALMGDSKASMSGDGAAISLNGDASLIGANVIIGSAEASDDEDEMEEIEPDVYFKITEEKAEIKALSQISILAESGTVEIMSEAAEAHLILDAETKLKAVAIAIEAENLTLKCSYGEETFENVIRRIERIEEQLGLPHTI